MTSFLHYDITTVMTIDTLHMIQLIFKAHYQTINSKNILASSPLLCSLPFILNVIIIMVWLHLKVD